MEIKKIGFIGVGIMGKSMVRNLMKKGFELSVYSRTKSKCLDVIEEGARWYDTAAECAKDQDAVITIVGFPKDVEEVYFGNEEKTGILDAARKGSVLIDMTTSSPRLAKKIYDAAKEKGLYALDAPVSGGDTGAKNGTLTIMVGGDREIYDELIPVFEAMGTNNTYEGKAGFGQHTKAVNQIIIAGTISAISEAVNYANKNGLDVQTVLDSICKGAAGSWQLDNNAPKMLAGDFDPGFCIKHFIKDMAIALDEGKASGAKLPVVETVIEMYREMDKEGFGDLGTQALIKYYEKE